MRTFSTAAARRSAACPAPHTSLIVLSAIAAAALVACGGGGGGSNAQQPPAQVDISGVVADGPLQGASVCYDLNDNGSCDSGEPTSASTDANGRYALSVAAADAGKHAVIVNVPASAIDKDSGAAVGVAFTLSAPATGSATTQDVFVSALTTVVGDLARSSGKTVPEAAADVQSALGLGVSPLANFVGAAGSADAALAAKALTTLVKDTVKLAADNGVPADKAAALLLNATTGNLSTVAASLAASSGATAEQRAADAAKAVQDELNLSAGTVATVADRLSAPPAPATAAGPFVSVRRFAYADANNYSYTLFTGDSSAVDTNGEFVAHEVRKTQSEGSDAPFNRNQVYWTGTDWKTCPLQWEVITQNKTATATTAGHSLYCGGSKSESRVIAEDIAGKTLREVLTKIRSTPLADSVGAHTDPVSGLPTRWGPDPSLLPAEATFPAGSQLSLRTTRVDIGGTDRIELTNKSSVRWADGRFRQAVTLEQYSGMPGDLKDASVVPSFSNVVYVFDLPLATQPDATLDAFKRYVAGLDVEALKIRFYKCDSRKSDQAIVNCAAAGDGTLAISTQGDARLLRVASGYPVELETRLKTQRFWAERSGAVFRGAHDIENTRYDQRLNAPAWEALRSALGIPAHAAPSAPAAFGPFSTLRNFTFADANNYSIRTFDGDSSVQDAQGFYMTNEIRETRSGGSLVPFVRNALYWTGTDWYDCPSDGVGINPVNSKAPFNTIYCKTYLEDRHNDAVLTLAGRRMSDVVNDIRRYGSRDYAFDYGNWGPNPALQTQLANSFFPAGSTMTYRGVVRKATPVAISTAATSRVRVAPADTSAAFDTWPFAATLAEMIAKYPGDLLGGPLNGATAIFVQGFDLPVAPAGFTTRVEIRVAFDANGNKARFWQNNRSATTGFTTNYVKLLDTTYSVETLGDAKVLKFAALPDGFERDFAFARMYAEKNGGVWYAYKDPVGADPVYSIRLNGTAFDALRAALGIPR